MESIKEATPKKYRSLIHPIKFTLVSDLPRYPHIDECYDKIIECEFFGEQYKWFPRYCTYHECDGIELALEAHEDEGRVWEILRSRTVRTNDGLILDELGPNDAVATLFGDLRFPTLHLTKLEMRELAAEAGFLNILKKSWFCHSPHRSKPCGSCNPCIRAMKEGMRERMPLYSRFRYYMRVLPRIKSIVRKHKHPRLYAAAKSIQQWMRN